MSLWNKPHKTALALVWLGCTGLVLGLYCVSYWQKFEYAAQDNLIRLGKKAEPDPRLVYLGIDEASQALDAQGEVTSAEVAESPALSLMKESGWPWRRDIYGLVFQRLIDAGASVVALDLLFPSSRDGDEGFAAALEKYRGHVVIGSNFLGASEPGGSGSDILAIPVPTVLASQDIADDRLGYVNFKQGLDERVRSTIYRSTRSEWFGNPPAPNEPVLNSLAAQVLERAGNVRKAAADTNPHLFRFMPASEVGEPAFTRLMKTASGVFSGKVAREVPGIQPISLYKIFTKKDWERPPFNNGKFFKGKIVLVAPEGNWSKDQAQTPLGQIAAPELHLNAMNAALHDDFLTELSFGGSIALIVAMGGVGCLLGVLIANPLYRIFALVGANVAYYAIAQGLYNYAGLYLLILSPLAAMSGTGFLWAAWEQILKEVEKARMRRTLERYVSKNVVKEILDNPRSFLNDLGGVRKSVAVLMTDLRGFTTITEEADSHQLVLQLNEYFGEMVRLVFAQKGTVDKFIGDAMLAVWGNVYTEGPARDVELAVQTAICMQQSLLGLNEGWSKRGIRSFSMGVGIEHGEALFGNIGSAEKMEPTVIGDVVNLASRLEGLTKEYGRNVLIGERAADLVKGRFHLQLVDHVRVKGKMKPVRVYAVLGNCDQPLPAEESAYLAAYNDAIKAYTDGDFTTSAALLKKCLEGRPEDALLKVYLERCDELAKTAPATWDGVFIAKSK